MQQRRVALYQEFCQNIDEVRWEMGESLFYIGQRIAVSLATNGGWTSAESAITEITVDHFVITRPRFDPAHLLGTGENLTVIASTAERSVRFDTSVLRVEGPIVVLNAPKDVDLIDTEPRRGMRASVRSMVDYSVLVAAYISPSMDRPKEGETLWQSCLLENVSESGAMIETSDTLELHNVLLLRFSLPQQGLFQTPGIVVRCTDAPTPKYGVRFSNLHPDDRRRIAAYVKEQSRSG